MSRTDIVLYKHGGERFIVSICALVRVIVPWVLAWGLGACQTDMRLGGQTSLPTRIPRALRVTRRFLSVARLKSRWQSPGEKKRLKKTLVSHHRDMLCRGKVIGSCRRTNATVTRRQSCAPGPGTIPSLPQTNATSLSFWLLEM